MDDKVIRGFGKPISDLTWDRVASCLTRELNGARQKFPSNEGLFAALVEEVGELAADLNRLIWEKEKYGTKNSDVFKEAIQVAAMAIRIAQEGDPHYPYTPNYDCYKDFKPTSGKANE